MFKSVSKVISTVTYFFCCWYHQSFAVHLSFFFAAGLALMILGGVGEGVRIWALN